MSDNRTQLTPIIVGVVIALLGILTGLYIADNAREQLALAQKEALSDEEMPAQEKVDLPALPSADDELPELPPLDPAYMEEPPVHEEDADVVEEEPIAPPVEDTTEVDIPEEDAEEVDDFEEVPLEELEEVPQSQDSI